MSSYAPYIERRKLLHNAIKAAHPSKKGSVVLFAAFEQHKHAFRQESTFFYLTGLEEPATIMVMDDDGTSTLWVPQYGSSRSQWVSTLAESDKSHAAIWGMKDIRHIGHPCKGYAATPACTIGEYEHLVNELTERVISGESLYMVYPTGEVTEQTLLIERLWALRPEIASAIVDISPLVASLRRTKSREELEMMYEAIDCTMQALEAVSMRIEPGLFEYQLQAAVEFVFREGGGSPAFPTIVGSGKNSTVLHYMANNNSCEPEIWW